MPVMRGIGALGLRQGLPQDRRVRPRDRRGADRSGAPATARVVIGAIEAAPIVLARRIAVVRRARHRRLQAAIRCARGRRTPGQGRRRRRCRPAHPCGRAARVRSTRRPHDARSDSRVNARAVQASVEPRTHLADFLRDNLDLTGTHLGCEHGVCGACTLLLDGVPARSCITYAVACDGAESPRSKASTTTRSRPSFAPPSPASMRCNAATARREC